MEKNFCEGSNRGFKIKKSETLFPNGEGLSQSIIIVERVKL
jgi:hypothetical protein